jgi:DNA-binding NarL/FixJ family response regulator
MIAMKKILIIDDEYNIHEDITDSLRSILNPQIRRIWTSSMFEMYGHKKINNSRVDGLLDVEVVSIFSQWYGFREAWAEEQKPDLIFMDACLDSSSPDTIPLIQKIRETSNVCIIAMSSSYKYTEEMVNAGANYNFRKGMEFEIPANTFEVVKKQLNVYP